MNKILVIWLVLLAVAMCSQSADAQCTCPCYADPVCDGTIDVLDVVNVLDAAWRAQSWTTTSPCSAFDQDLNCDGQVGTVDVILCILIAFRNQGAACDPSGGNSCPPIMNRPADQLNSSVTIESKAFITGQVSCTVGVYLSNDVPILGLVMPFEFREQNSGAFIASSLTAEMNPSGRLKDSPLGLASPAGCDSDGDPSDCSWPDANITTRRFSSPSGTLCSGPTSNSYASSSANVDFVSPDACFHAAVSNGTSDPISLLPGSDLPGTPSYRFIFGVTNSHGSFVIDTCCIGPGNHLLMTQENGHNDLPVRLSFTTGVIQIGSLTPTGSNVLIDVDSVEVSFSQVSTAGITSISQSSSGPPPPSGFNLVPLSPARYYDIQSTAVYSPPATVCITYDEAWLTRPEPLLRLFHYEGGTWVDCTSSRDMTNNIICGQVSSFSPFILAEPNPCACDCHADPANCDGVRNVLDVTAMINVAFRGFAAIPDPNANCPRETTDINCDAVTSVLDVTKMINVAFRGANAATEFCDPCP